MRMLYKNEPRAQAFTLIETIIAITLVTLVLTAVTGLVLTTLLGNQRNLHSVQGMYLAQEGLEAVRFMRDSNWLQNYSWNGGASLWGGDFDLSSEPSLTFYLKEDKCPPCFVFSTFEADGVVQFNNGLEFTRSLTFTPIPDEEDPTQNRADTVEVTATVRWLEKGVLRSTALSTYLTNWK